MFKTTIGPETSSYKVLWLYWPFLLWLTALSGLISSDFVSQEPACGVSQPHPQASKPISLLLFWLSLLCLVICRRNDWEESIHGTCTNWAPNYLACCNWYPQDCIIFGTTRKQVIDGQKEVGIHNRKRRRGRWWRPSSSYYSRGLEMKW